MHQRFGELCSETRIIIAWTVYLDSCGLLVPALNRVGEAWVNHFSDSKL